MIQAIPRDPGGQVVPLHQVPTTELLRIRCAESGIHFEHLDLVLALEELGQWAGQMLAVKTTSEQLADVLGCAPSTVRKRRATLPETTWMTWASTGRGYRVVIDLGLQVTPDAPEPSRAMPEVFPAVPDLTRSVTSCSLLFSSCSVPSRADTCCSRDVPSCSPDVTFRPAADTGEGGTSVAHARATSKTSSKEEVKQQHAASVREDAAAADGDDEVDDGLSDEQVLEQDITSLLTRHDYAPDPHVVRRCVSRLFDTGIDLEAARDYAAMKLSALIERGPDRYERWRTDQLFSYLLDDCASYWLSEQSRRARAKQPTPETTDDNPFRKSSASYREKIAQAMAAKRAREQAVREGVRHG